MNDTLEQPEPVASERPWKELERIADAGDGARLGEYVDSLAEEDAAWAMAHLASEDQARVLQTLTPSDAAELLDELPDAFAADLLEQIPASDAAAILSELRSDDRADVLAEVGDERAEEILTALDPRAARELRTLAGYPSDQAGGLMVTEFLAFPERATVGDVIEDLRANAESYADYQVQYAYVEAADGRLVGVLRLRDLLLSRPKTPVASIMLREPTAVGASTPLEDLEGLFDRHEFLALPIVDEERRMIGVLLRSTLRSASEERSASSHLKQQGIVGGEELRSMPFGLRARRRLSWLSVNIGLNVLAASVIAAYEEVLSSVIALAVFLPILSDMSGCAGNQAVAVSMRELSLGLVRPHEVLRVWLKEISVGLIIGLVLGALLFAVATLWRGNPYLGLVVGFAMAVNTLVAVSIGGTVPLLLRWIGIDPALASGPLLTTVTDMCAFFFALSLASALLSRIGG